MDTVSFWQGEMRKTGVCVPNLFIPHIIDNLKHKFMALYLLHRLSIVSNIWGSRYALDGNI